MNPNFRVQVVDGFGEREDIALERDKQQGIILENQRNYLIDIDLAVNAATEYGTAADSRLISSIVLEMLEEEIYQRQFLKSQVIWDVESLSEAVTEACIKLGLSDEEFSPNSRDLGNQIVLELF